MIIYRKAALKRLSSVDKQTRNRIKAAIDKLPYEGDIKRLQGITPPEYRLRVGGYRVLFARDGETVIINNIDLRGSIYK